MKTFTSEHGVALDANFVSHAALCERCREFDPDRPHSATLLCLEGSVLWKRENIERPPPKRRDENIVSRDEAKRQMRYKE